MNRKYFSLLIFFTCFSMSYSLMGQGIEDLVKNRHAGIYEKKITFDRKPAPLPGVREADVIWSKTVWRMVDLREKMNQHLYFPTKETQGRTNLINLLLKGVRENTITAFDAMDEENEFVKPISYDQVKSKFGASVKIIKRRNFETGLMEDVPIQTDLGFEEVKQLIIKEIWYFDKQKSTLQVRILGICPIRLFYREEDAGQENLQRQKLFWVYYPEIRPLLAKNEVLNTKNGARNFSFDDLFLIRNFDGYIVKEENIYNNRDILSYADGEIAAQESDRIKNAIFNYEQDLWEY